MAKIKLTKNELKVQKDALKMYRRYLPTLTLKKQQLQAEIRAIEAKAIAVCSLSGMTARMVSRFRPPVSIIGLTTEENTWRELSLSWGVIPVLCENFNSTDVLFYTAKKIATKELGLAKGDRIVITGGDTTGYSGNTNLIKIEEI